MERARYGMGPKLPGPKWPARRGPTRNGRARNGIHLAKIATKNRINRHLAGFNHSALRKVLEDQILCGKLVS